MYIFRHYYYYCLFHTVIIQFPSFNGTTITFIAVSTRALPFDTYQVQCEASNSHGTSSASVNFVIVQVRIDGKYVSMDIEYAVHASDTLSYICMYCIVAGLWHRVYKYISVLWTAKKNCWPVILFSYVCYFCLL